MVLKLTGVTCSKKPLWYKMLQCVDETPRRRTEVTLTQSDIERPDRQGYIL